MRKINTRTIVYLGVLTALEIVLNRFLSINAWNIKIGFNFVPIAVAAILFGPIPAGIVGALGGLKLHCASACWPGFWSRPFWGMYDKNGELITIEFSVFASLEKAMR